MTPVLPIEALTVPMRTGQVMGLWTSPIEAVSRQIASLPAFPELYKLGSQPYDGHPLPVGLKLVHGPILDPTTLNILSQQQSGLTNIAVAGMPGGGFAWFRRTGDCTGTKRWQDTPGGEKRDFDPYIYFSSKIKRHNLSEAYWLNRSYKVKRLFVPAQTPEVWRINIFDEATQTAANAAGGLSAYSVTEAGLEAYEQTPYPGQDDTGEEYTLTWKPLFTEGVSAWGTLEPGNQPWLKLQQIEIPVNGNSVIASQQIETLFPISAATPDVDEAKRAYARRFAYPLDWDTQQREFDTAVGRQGEIPALNCVPIPSFETNVGGLIPPADFRAAFEQFGDYCAMAWRPVDNDESSVWVLNRIRVPLIIELPPLTPQVVGLADWFQGETLYESATSTTPIFALNAQRTVGDTYLFSTKEENFVMPFGGIGTDRSYVKTYALNSNVGTYSRTKQFQTSYGNSESYLRSEPFTQAQVDAAIENPSLLGGASALGSFPCIGFSKAAAMAATPALIRFQNSFWKVAGDPPQGTLGNWTVIVAKVAETGLYTTVSKTADSTSPDLKAQIQAQLDANTIADWANNFYQNQAKYQVIGTYKWTLPDGRVLHEQDIWGHTDLVASFTVELEFQG